MQTNESLGNKKIVYKSSWELLFCKYVDANSNILKVSSEPFPIVYFNPYDSKEHRYYPDFLIKVKENNNSIETYLIEIKPYKEVKDAMEGVKKHANMKEYTYKKRIKTAVQNNAKWQAAKNFCLKNKIKFKILTEKELQI